ALVVIPGFFGRAFRQTREVFRICDRLFVTPLRNIGKQREVEAFDRLAAFVSEFGANAAFVLEAGDLMTTGAGLMANPLLAFILQFGIVHEGSVGVGRWFLLLSRKQVGGDVLGIFYAEAQAGHDGHVLHLQLVAVVRASAVFQVKDVGQAFLRIVFGT